ncbi:MAG: DUF4249 domain-containing protein [Cytophagia bacterium]|nr:MAG: DUF4249 domain-containing protein [Sphingobacteriales bacterium]TAG44997.1 MAG: DUF4249 domain-containing protein [Cytophagia bacterium]
MKSLIALVITALIFSSCEKIVELDLSNNINKMVVDANITNQPGPYFVKLSKSVNFNEISTYPAVNNAVVIITDNTGQKDTLSYTSSGIYKTNNLQGVEGRTYYLTIKLEGKNYTAQSTMPSKIPLDSLRINTFKFNGKDQISVIPIYKDPTFLGNNYRFIQTINSKPDETYFAYNDNLNNGETNQRPLRSNDQDLELKTGDKVKVEMRCIDLHTYNYFLSLSQQTGGAFGGGSAPANPPNNITGGALGIFSAHTMQTKTIVIQ